MRVEKTPEILLPKINTAPFPSVNTPSLPPASEIPNSEPRDTATSAFQVESAQFEPAAFSFSAPTTTTQVWGSPPSGELPLMSTQELRQVFRDKIFPAIKEALNAQGLSVNESRCNTAAAYTQLALERLGIGGGELSNTMTHITVRVQTSDGNTLIIDPTLSQFFTDGTEIDEQMREQGFIGTEDELMDLFVQHAEDWDYTQHYTPVSPFQTYTPEQQEQLQFLHEVHTGMREADAELVQNTVESLQSSRILRSDSLSDASQVYQDFNAHNQQRQDAFQLLMGVFRGEVEASPREIEEALMQVGGNFEPLPENYEPMSMNELMPLVSSQVENIVTTSLGQDFPMTILSLDGSAPGILSESSQGIIDSYHGQRPIQVNNGEARGMDTLVRELDR